GNNVVRKVDTSGAITTVAGVWIVSPFAINGVTGVLLGVTGQLAVVQGPNGVQTANIADATDGLLATQTYLNGPQGLAVDSAGKYLYIADTGNAAVRRVDLATGISITIAGVPNSGGNDGAAPGGLTVP